MTNAITIGLSGLNAATSRANAAASNIANAQTTGSLDLNKQNPYTPIDSAQTSLENGQGVGAAIVSRNQPFIPSYDPDSPFADENGTIGTPNVDTTTEFVNLSLAKTQYSASLAIIDVAKDLDNELLNLLDDRV